METPNFLRNSSGTLHDYGAFYQTELRKGFDSGLIVEV
jgi:hypothetical protein